MTEPTTKFELNEELGFEWNDCWITNPYVCEGATWIECDPLEEYGKTNEELLTIFKSQAYLDWLKQMGDGSFQEKVDTEDINLYEFNIKDTWEQIYVSLVIDKDHEYKVSVLEKPSGLTKVLLLSNWEKQHYREVDFTGTTNEEAIKKILAFYKHKTYRRLVGDHTFFEGFTEVVNGAMRINLGS